MTIAIVKYGMGNVASVQKVLNRIGYNSIITNDHYDIKSADLILLPGVGSFKKGMENLSNLGLAALLTEEVVTHNKPFIGICLGMQLVATYGTEPNKVRGLGWIDGEVIKIQSSKKFKIPHIGWNTIRTTNRNKIYSEFNNQDFYFIHSFHFKANNPNEVTITVDYDGEIVAGLHKNNIHVMQFHPEKSQEAGMNMLKRIINVYA